MGAIKVVIPAYYTERTLQSCLDGLIKSTISAQLQIVVVDDGGNPNLKHLLAPYSVKLVSTGEVHSAAHARNLGAGRDESEILVFVDSDVVVESDTIERLVQPIVRGTAEATVGNYSKKVEGLNFAQRYKQLYVSCIYSRRKGYIENEFWTALGAVKTSVYRELGGLNTSFQGATGEDVELGIRMTCAGYRIFQVPDAVGQHLHAFNIIRLVRNDCIKGMNLSQNIFLKHTGWAGNRHSSLRDIVAVFLAGILSIIGLGQLVVSLSPGLAWVATLPLLLGYLVARGDLLETFRQAGLGFWLKSIPTMYLLDLVRVLCVSMGFLLVWTNSKQRQPCVVR